MTTTQTLAVSRDLADLFDLCSEVPVPATDAALDAWRLTVTPVTARRTTQATDLSLAAPSGTYTTGRTTIGGIVAATASLAAVGTLLVSALTSAVGA